MNGTDVTAPQLDLPLREWWSPDSLFPHSLREPIEVLVALGVPIGHLDWGWGLDWERGIDMRRDWSHTHELARESAVPSLRALDDWCPGDGVIALTDDRFGVIEVNPRLGGMQYYAQIEHLVRMTNPIGILETHYGGFEVLIDDPQFGVDGPGIQVLAGGCNITLPANDEPGIKGYPRWRERPAFGTRRISGRVIPAQLRHALAAVMPPLQEEDWWIDAYQGPDDSTEVPPSTLSESATSTILTSEPADLLVELYLAAASLNVSDRDNTFVRRCENDLLSCVAGHPDVHDVGVAACLAAIRSGLQGDPPGSI